MPEALAALLPSFIALYTSDRPQQELRAELGALALAANTESEDEWLARFGGDEGLSFEEWPSRAYGCTAVDAVTGEFVVWTAESGAPLQRAVASSCAVPGIFPPVTINGRRYVDGGMRTATNADIASGHDRVLVVSVTAGAASLPDPMGEIVRRRDEAELDALRSSGSAVAVITPGEDFVQAFGLNLMDFSKRLEATEMGVCQGHREATRIRSFWG
jgi:NTE family protein